MACEWSGVMIFSRVLSVPSWDFSLVCLQALPVAEA